MLATLAIVTLGSCARGAGTSFHVHNDAGVSAIEAGDCKGAIANFERAVADPGASVSVAMVATARDNLGVAYKQCGRYPEAEAQYAASLVSRRATLGEAHPDVGYSLNNIGALAIARGEPAAAVAALREAEAIFAAADDVEMQAKVLVNLGVALRESGAIDEALGPLEKGLALRRVRYGENHRDTAAAYDAWSSALAAKGRDDEAIAASASALAIRERVLPAGHPLRGVAHNNHADVLIQVDRLAEAVPELRTALGLLEASRGPDHVDVGTTCENLGFVLSRLGRPAEAEPFYARALAIAENVHGPTSAEAEDSRSRLAVVRGQLPVPDRATGVPEPR